MKTKNFKETEYGFDWGAMQIERVASLDDGSVIVLIKTEKEFLEVRATMTGFIRTQQTKRKNETQKIPLQVEQE